MKNTTITPERKSFEEWCLKNNLDTAPEHELNEETYFYPKTEGAWMAWQAAIQAYLASLPEGGPTNEDMELAFFAEVSVAELIADDGSSVPAGLVAVRALFAADKAGAVAEKDAIISEREDKILELTETICITNAREITALKASLSDARKVRDKWCAEYTQARDKLAAAERERDELRHPKGTWPEPIEIMDVMKIRDEEDARNISRLFAGFIGDYESLRQRVAELEKDNKAAKATLVDACICTNHNPGFARKGWAYCDSERAYLEIEYRDWPIFPTAEEAVNDALAKRITEMEEQS